MTTGGSNSEQQKRSAAEAAAELIVDNTVLGLGSGSTVRYFIEELGKRLASGLLSAVRGVPTSVETEELARRAGVPIIDLPSQGVDLAVDGMDEVDAELRAIKGLGGALTREKIVATAAREFVLIGDGGKFVERLAERTPIPVEVVPFGWRMTARHLEELGLEPTLRQSAEGPFESDNGFLILDCRLRGPQDLEALAVRLESIPGVLEHGLFLEIADLALVAGKDGVRELRKNR